MDMFVLNPEIISTLISLCVFFCVSLAAYYLFNPFRKRVEIRQRFFSQKMSDVSDTSSSGKSDGNQNLTSVCNVLLSFSSNLVPSDKKTISAVRKVVMQAGFLHPSAVSWYYFARIGLAITLPAAVFIAFELFDSDMKTSKLALLLVGSNILGLMLPQRFMSYRKCKLRQQCRKGFPDLLDLMVVCSGAGISLDAALQRVRPCFCKTYPYLAYNIKMVCLELQAGGSLFDAFESLAERLGIQEALTVGALMRQSQELGTSLSDGLRVYSEEMRDKRLSLTEEKAHALPAKMAVPLMVFIFPVVLVVILLPGYIKMGTVF